MQVLDHLVQILADLKSQGFFIVLAVPQTILGQPGLSTVMSAWHRCTSGSKLPSLGVVSSIVGISKSVHLSYCQLHAVGLLDLVL